MRMPIAVVMALCGLAGVGLAADRQSCEIPGYLLFGNSELRRVADVVAREHRLTIAVVGTGSSTLAGTDGPGSAYPARLEAALRERLPSLAIKLVTTVRTRTSAEDQARGMAKLLVDEKPDLVIWQTGTFDAIRRIEVDDFRAALDEGIDALHKAGTDVILMNMQHSPRTETMVSLGPYAETMRFVAQLHEIPLFDRLAIMRHWSDTGVFDLYAAGKEIELARQVHDCIGRGLASMIIEAAHLNTAELKTRQ